MARPLIRWIVRKCTKDGLDVLEHSIGQAKKLYPECDFAIFHDLDNESIYSLGVSTHNQYNFYNPWKEKWGFWPPRFRLYSHEICMSNDLVLTKRHPLIDNFLTSDDMFFAIEGTAPNYGKYTNVVPKGVPSIKSSLYGMPPQFDFAQWLKKFIAENRVRRNNKWNSQGIIAAMIKSQPNYAIITKNDIITTPQMRLEAMKDIVERVYGLHFVGINKSLAIDQWAFYKTAIKWYEKTHVNFLWAMKEKNGANTE